MNLKKSLGKTHQHQHSITLEDEVHVGSTRVPLQRAKTSRQSKRARTHDDAAATPLPTELNFKARTSDCPPHGVFCFAARSDLHGCRVLGLRPLVLTPTVVRCKGTDIRSPICRSFPL